VAGGGARTVAALAADAGAASERGSLIFLAQAVARETQAMRR